MEVIYSARFEKEFRKLPRHIQARAAKHELRFKENTYDPQLKTHALKGKLNGFHAFSITNAYRIIFEFYINDVVIFLRVGKHDIYDV